MAGGADPEALRRARHDELNRTLILDAAEETFAVRGFEGGSVREIARRAGFSTAALYLYFANKTDLYGQMLVRRGAELHEAMTDAADGSPSSGLEQLHRMADAAIVNYRKHPHFARLVALAHAARLGSPLGAWQDSPDERVRTQYEQAMELEARVIGAAQARGEIRDGDRRALAHLFSVLVNSYLAVGAPVDDEDDDDDGERVEHAPGLTVEQLHEIIDGAFRPPS
jgi:TetR/AcrR family transcriptional regulator